MDAKTDYKAVTGTDEEEPQTQKRQGRRRVPGEKTGSARSGHSPGLNSPACKN